MMHQMHKLHEIAEGFIDASMSDIMHLGGTVSDVLKELLGCELLSESCPMLVG